MSFQPDPFFASSQAQPRFLQRLRRDLNAVWDIYCRSFDGRGRLPPVM